MKAKKFNTNSSLKIKIVIATEFVGFDSGWPTRYIGLIRELNKYHSLSIFAPGDTSLLSQMFPESSVCRKTRLPKRRASKRVNLYNYFRQVINPSRYAPLKADPPYSEEFHNLILLEPTKYDVSIYFGMNSFVFYGKEDRTPLIFCDLCDSYLRHKYNEIKMSKKKGIKDHLSSYFDVMYIKKFKRKFFPSNIMILAITDEDCKYISSVLKENKIFTVPNGISIPNGVNESGFITRKYRSPYLVFIGSLDYKPNIESIFFTVENLWPAIHTKFPNMTFRIVGRAPTAELVKKVRNVRGVELVGPVENVSEYYLNSKCFLGPIFSGGGMKNKFLESLSAGTPVITTSEGAIGINMKTGFHGKIANTKSELLKATFDILSCSEDEYSRYVNSSVLLAREYSWERIGILLNNIIFAER